MVLGVPFMRIIYNQHRVSSQSRLCQEFLQKHTIRHVLQLRFVAGAVFKSNGTLDLIPKFCSCFFCNTGQQLMGLLLYVVVYIRLSVHWRYNLPREGIVAAGLFYLILSQQPRSEPGLLR